MEVDRVRVRPGVGEARPRGCRPAVARITGPGHGAVVGPGREEHALGATSTSRSRAASVVAAHAPGLVGQRRRRDQQGVEVARARRAPAPASPIIAAWPWPAWSAAGAGGRRRAPEGGDRGEPGHRQRRDDRRRADEHLTACESLSCHGCVLQLVKASCNSSTGLIRAPCGCVSTTVPLSPTPRIPTPR